MTAGASKLRGSYRPTPKNGQVAAFYPDRGFTATGEGLYEVSLPLSVAPEHVVVLRDA